LIVLLLFPPRVRTPAHRCKHGCFGMRLRGYLRVEAVVVHWRRHKGWAWG